MLYYLFDYLDKILDIPGAGVFQYITFRSGLAVILSLLISTIYGKKIIEFLRNQQVGETIRELGLEGQTKKAGTPTMGGLIIILATLIPVFLLAKLDNIYIVLLIVTTLWMGTIGFIDDYIKIFKKDKEGLKGKFKVIGQVGLGIIVGSVLYFHPGVTVRKDTQRTNILAESNQTMVQAAVEEKSTATTIPFFKNNEFDYADVLSFLGDGFQEYAWLIFIPIVIFIITAVSNGANLTDGIDGLAAGTSAISVLTLGIFTFVSGNIIFSNYLNIMYIPNSGEMTVFISAFVGSLIGFLWYNSYPAAVFMGDTGSLAIGGIIAAFAILIRKELLIPVLCGVFLIENLSVILQVSYFKFTKKKYGEGITFTPFFIDAVAKAIRDFPMINISVDGDKIIKKKDINIGIAVALPSGNLIVPNIKNADQFNLTGLSKKVNDLALRARNNKLSPDELGGGTYTISNVGSFGNVMGTPIIMQPQVAILAVGAITKKPAVVETPTGDVIAIRHKMFLSHSYDHRVVDGSLGGMFVKRVADYLEEFNLDTEL